MFEPVSASVTRGCAGPPKSSKNAKQQKTQAVKEASAAARKAIETVTDAASQLMLQVRSIAS